MIAYWLFFGVFAIGALFSRGNASGKKRLGSLAVALVLITLMIGLRWDVGTDWDVYLRWWNQAGYMSLDGHWRSTRSDVGFSSLMWIFRNAGAPYWLFNVFMAAIFATALVVFSRAQANPWLAVAVAVPWLVFVVAMSGIRQATAVGCVFFAIEAFRRRLGLKFLLCMALAASFHASAILFLPLAGLSFARSRLTAFLLIAVTAIAGYYFLSGTFNVYSERYLSRAVESAGTIFRIVMTVVPALAYLALQRYFPAEPHERSLWRNLSLASLIAIPIYYFIQSSTALDRVLLYLFPLQMYVLAALPTILGGRKGAALMTLLTVGYLGLQLFVFFNYGVNRMSFIPYQTVFSGPAWDVRY